MPEGKPSPLKLGIGSEIELRRAFGELERTAAAAGGRIEGWIVQEHIPGGREALIRAVRDRRFGPCVIFEPVGFWTRLFRDGSFRLAPLTVREATEMIAETFAYHIFKGVDGSAPVDVDALASVICKVGELVSRFERISEISLHPLKILERGAKAVAVEVLLEEE